LSSRYLQRNKEITNFLENSISNKGLFMKMPRPKSIKKIDSLNVIKSLIYHK